MSAANELEITGTNETTDASVPAKQLADTPTRTEAESVLGIMERQDALICKVQKSLRAGMEQDVQRELARLLGLLPQLEGDVHMILLGLADVAVSALLLDQPDLELAGGIRQRIEKQVRRSRNPLWAIFHGRSPSGTVILGLGCLLYFAIPIAVNWLPRLLSHEKVFGIEPKAFLMIALSGAVGSIVSIMVRIQDFSYLPDANAVTLFFTGFFKPVVGAAFAMFVFSVIHAGIIPITVQPSTANYFFLALAFVSGFSERFARDIATTAERQIGGAAANLQQAPA